MSDERGNVAESLVFDAGSPGIHVDLDRLVSSRMLLQANSGGGKSRALRYILEQTHGRIQHVVIDPEGEFASLRERFPYLLAAPRGGDVVADPRTAKLLARRVMELRVSVVIDLYELQPADRRKFVRIFLHELMHLPRALWHPALIVIDEAQQFAPERGHGEAESTEAVVTLCAQGRKRGYSALLATQRLSKLLKDVAAELHNKMIGYTSLDVDVKRAGDELGMGKDERAALRQLEPGEFWVFGPALSRVPTLVRTGDVVTTHPEPGTVAPPAAPTPAAIRELVEQLADLPQEAEAEARDLTTLQARVRDLEARLRVAEKRTEPDPAVVSRAVADAVTALREQLAGMQRRAEAAEEDLRSDQQRLAEYEHTFVAYDAQLNDAWQRAKDLMAVLEKEPAATPPAPIPPRAAPPAPRTVQVSSPQRTSTVQAAPAPRAAAPASQPAAVGDAAVSGPQQRILVALASFEALGITPLAKGNVAVFSDASPKSSSFANNLGRLRSLGLIEYAPGGVELTEDGRAQAGYVDAPESVTELHQAWCTKMSGPQARIITALAAIYPDSLARDELAAATDQSPTSSSYANNLGALRSLGLIDYGPGKTVHATKLLFPDGLPRR